MFCCSSGCKNKRHHIACFYTVNLLLVSVLGCCPRLNVAQLWHESISNIVKTIYWGFRNYKNKLLKGKFSLNPANILYLEDKEGGMLLKINYFSALYQQYFNYLRGFRGFLVYLILWNSVKGSGPVPVIYPITTYQYTIFIWKFYCFTACSDGHVVHLHICSIYLTKLFQIR